MSGYMDIDDNGNLREVLLDVDGDVPKDTGPYLVQVWVYRYGFEDKRRFHTEAEAMAYAQKKAAKRRARYRVMGPIEEQE